MSEDQNTTVSQPQVGGDDLLADLFRASAELRFHIKSLKLTRVEQNPSWHRHTEIMRKVEMHLK